MSDEAQYSSGADTAFNERKYDDQAAPPPATRRHTGFSAPITPHSPDSAPPSYNAVAPPIEGLIKAKERAQEVTVPILISSAGVLDEKQPTFKEGASGFDSHESGFSSIPPDVKPHTLLPTMRNASSSKKIDIPNARGDLIIGECGKTIRNLQTQSGAKIQITQVELMGTPEQIAKAEQLITDFLSKVSQRLTGLDKRHTVEMKIPNNKVCLVIGKGGSKIRSMQDHTGAHIQVIPLYPPPGDTSTTRTLQIKGTKAQIQTIEKWVNEIISENHVKNPSMAGCYPQQGYQARPPTGWGTHGAPPLQQPGYGFVQVYPESPPQYNMSQPPYSGYPPQPVSGGYASNWDQSAVPPSQQTSQGGVNDNSGYWYGQQGQEQGYTQYGYGRYQAQPQSGYGQLPSYDQQQGYASAPTYGNVTNPTQDGHAPSYGSQGDSTQAPPVQPSSVGQQGNTSGQQPSLCPASYPTQGTMLPGYGIPPTSKAGYGNQPPAQPVYGPGYGATQAQKPLANPPVYGQPMQLPGGTPGGYGQPAPVQPGYPRSQPDSGLQGAPPSTYGAAAGQPGYAAPPYGALPVSQPGYGQAPLPLNAYGAAYSQNAGGNSRGTYDLRPTRPN